MLMLEAGQNVQLDVHQIQNVIIGHGIMETRPTGHTFVEHSRATNDLALIVMLYLDINIVNDKMCKFIIRSIWFHKQDQMSIDAIWSGLRLLNC